MLRGESALQVQLPARCSQPNEMSFSALTKKRNRLDDSQIDDFAPKTFCSKTTSTSKSHSVSAPTILRNSAARCETVSPTRLEFPGEEVRGVEGQYLKTKEDETQQINRSEIQSVRLQIRSVRFGREARRTPNRQLLRLQLNLQPPERFCPSAANNTRTRAGKRGKEREREENKQNVAA